MHRGGMLRVLLILVIWRCEVDSRNVTVVRTPPILVDDILVQVSCRGLGGSDLPFKLHVPPGNTLSGLNQILTTLTGSAQPVTHIFELDSGARIQSLDEIDEPILACHADPWIAHQPMKITVPEDMGRAAGAAAGKTDSLQVVRTVHGPMAVLGSDVVGKLLMKFGGYSEQQLQLLSDLIRPGSAVVDAGANWGSHTLAFSRIVGSNGSVHAFEPQPLLISGLKRSVSLNDIQNVESHQVALGAVNGHITIPVTSTEGEETFASTLSLRFNPFNRIRWHVAANLGEGQLIEYKRQDPNTLQVPLRTLDSYIYQLQEVSLIRLVVEGMEEEAVRGAQQILRKHRPYLYIQQTQQANSAQSGSLIYLLTELLDYELYYYYSPHIDFELNHDDSEYSCITLDILGVPKEKVHLHSMLLSRLEKPRSNVRRLRQYIRCHRNDGTVLADLQFECLREASSQCRCRMDDRTKLRKCDARPLTSSFNYTASLEIQVDEKGSQKIRILIPKDVIS